jgi:hypothetical protein
MGILFGGAGGSSSGSVYQPSIRPISADYTNQAYPPRHGTISAPITVGANRILNATTGTFPSGWSVTRAAGGATYLDSSGVLQTASANTIRTDYIWNGSSYVVGGILVEPASANSVPSFTGSLANASLGTAVTGIDGTADATAGYSKHKQCWLTPLL